MSSSKLLAALATGAMLAACNGGVSGNGNGGGVDAGGTVATPDADLSPFDQALAARKVDYGQALRTAALRLVGDLPTLTEIKFVAEATDQKTAYESIIDSYLNDPRFARQMRNFFRDTFRMGEGTFDSAPNFAAELAVEGRSYTELFTAAAGNCPSFDAATGTFMPQDCASGAPVQAGVLTNPDVMLQFFSNMAFRRVRWVQETFACTKFPAELTAPTDLPGATAKYTSPWPFESIAGHATGGAIDFRDTSAVICANCHTTINHQAPLFAHFDAMGMWQADFAVPTPAEGAPTVTLADYLVPGEQTAWRLGVPAADLAAFGASMAADPAVGECAVARAWNWAMGKGDIVYALAAVPPQVIAQQTADFNNGGHSFKALLRSVFTSDDFVKF